jgi:hypothetical protein
METCLDFLREMPNEDIATVLRMVQQRVKKCVRYNNICKRCIVLIVTSALSPPPDKPRKYCQFAKVSVSERKVSVTLLYIRLLY